MYRDRGVVFRGFNGKSELVVDENDVSSAGPPLLPVEPDPPIERKKPKKPVESPPVVLESAEPVKRRRG